MLHDEFTVMHPRAAGIDVHKMQLTASVRIHQPDGDALVATETFAALPSGRAALVAWLKDHRVKAVVMESTGIYWLAPYEALEDAGIATRLVNAYQVKQLKGRKTDISDSLWLARVCQFGLANASFVPPRVFRELRSVSRHRRKLIGQRTSVTNRVHKLLDRHGVQIGGILADLFGVNGRRLLDGLIRGDDRRTMLASLTGHVARKLDVLGDALTMSLTPIHRHLLQDLVSEHDALGDRIARIDQELHAGLAPWQDQLELLQTIPGIDIANARELMVEIGPDLTVFDRADRLAA